MTLVRNKLDARRKFVAPHAQFSELDLCVLGVMISSDWQPGYRLASMHQNCPECQRLWREYAAATNTHVGLESKLREAVRQHDTASMEALTRDIASAAELRDSLRRAIQQHEATAHEGTANAADSDR